MQTFEVENQQLRGAHSIEASAGTGKTHSITVLWLRLIIEENLGVENVLVSTFTKAATAELKERLLSTLQRANDAATTLTSGKNPADSPESRIVQTRLANSFETIGELRTRLSQALSAFDLAPISTLHSFCQSLIKRQAIELGTDPGQTLVPNCEDHLLPIVHDELLRLSSTTDPDPSSLSKIANTVASKPYATILGWTSTDSEILSSLQETVCTQTERAIPEGVHHATRKSLVKAIENIRSGELVGPPTPKQKEILGPAIIALWKQYDQTLQTSQQSAPQQMASAVRNRLEGAKQAAGIRTFDDMTRTVRAALSKQGRNGPLAQSVRSRLKAAIIDECQDSDSVQIGVFADLFLHEDTLSFIVIGDPKQSIYRFRGADLESYRKLASDTVPAPRMDTNFRSDAGLIEALNGLYGEDFAFPDQIGSSAPVRYTRVKAASSGIRMTDPSHPQPVVMLWTDETNQNLAQKHLAKMAAAECHRLLNSGVTIEDRHTKQMRKLLPGDIAFLASSARQLRAQRAFLGQLGIPTELSGRGLGSVLQSEEAMDILTWLEILQGLQNRGDVLAKLLAFLASPLSGCVPANLPEITNSSHLQAIHCATLKSELDAVERHGPLPVILERMAKTEVVRANLSYADGERRFTNWRHLASILQEEHAAGHRGAAALLLRLSRMIAQSRAGALDEDENLMCLETDLPAVQLMTIHASKGLEFPVVFCPFLWSLRSRQRRTTNCHAPLIRTASGWQIDVGSANFHQHRQIALDQEDNEEHRKLYVALTRPRHRLYIGCAPVPSSSGGNNGADLSPLGQLPGLALVGRPLIEWRASLENNPWIFLQSDPNAFGAIQVSLHHPQRESGALQTSALKRGNQLAFHGLPKRVSSFSSLSKSATDSHSPKDRDEENPRLAASRNEYADLLSPLGDPGAELGDQVHSVLEEFLGNHIPIADALGSLKKDAPREAWGEAVHKIVTSPFDIPQGGKVTLEEIRNRCITEMQFHLPVPQVGANDLASALLRDPEISAHPTRCEWARSVGQFGFEPFTGFLQGYIDLIFEHEGRWYVVDYKTNRLDGYQEGDLEHAMQAHHYLLQARLYALALHRHLSVHLHEYDYAKHFGGIVYLFLRGMPDTGVWAQTPSREALEHFSNLFLPS